MTRSGRPEAPLEIDIVLHDLKNLMTVISGHSQLMLARLKKRDPLWRNAEAIRRAAESGTAMMLAVLAPATAAQATDTDVDVNAVVTAAARMLDGSMGQHVEVAMQLAAGRVGVQGVARDLEQVVMNLIVNARDAMPDGGRLVLETGTLIVPDTWGRRSSDPEPGTWVTIAVSDTGSGMEPRIRARLFEPYFTTKPTGSGLGLVTAHDIVRRHGGVITVASMVGCGSRFTVFLPWRAEAEAMIEGAAAPTPGRARETVLVVEDEPELRELVSEVLQLQGYTVLEARSAEDGLAVAAHHAGRIDLVITDVFMPGMAPRPFVEALRRTRPEARIMYVSGHSDDEIVRRAGEVEGVLLRKPFSIGVLAAKVRQVLDGQ
jgi:CheY-like chemotaxis protein